MAFVCGYFDRYIFEYIGEKLSSKYKLTTFNKMMRMHMSFFDLKENSPGKLSESIIEKTNSINGVIFNFLSKISEFVGMYWRNYFMLYNKLGNCFMVYCSFCFNFINFYSLCLFFF